MYPSEKQQLWYKKVSPLKGTCRGSSFHSRHIPGARPPSRSPPWLPWSWPPSPPSTRWPRSPLPSSTRSGYPWSAPLVHPNGHVQLMSCPSDCLPSEPSTTSTLSSPVPSTTFTFTPFFSMPLNLRATNVFSADPFLWRGLEVLLISCFPDLLLFLLFSNFSFLKRKVAELYRFGCF